MNRELLDREPATAIPVTPQTVVTRSASSRGSQLNRLLLVGSTTLIVVVSLVWYYSRPAGHGAGAGPIRSAAAAEFRLPALKVDPPSVAGEGAPSGDATNAEPSGNPLAPADAPGSAGPQADAGRRVRVDSPRDAGAGGPDDAPVLWHAHPESAGGDRDGGGRREPGLLAPGYAPVRASRLPPPTYVLSKGTAIGCTLETAIDSQLAGLVSCLIGSPIRGADAKIVLMPRGTRLLGEARSDVRAGQSRVFVLWVEARTPDGVLVPLASPATDALGRAGVPGRVDTHFFERFGAALMISVVDAAIQGALARPGATVVVSPQSSEAVLTEILRNTVAVPPTITVPTGARLSVLVARDVDFSGTEPGVGAVRE